MNLRTLAADLFGVLFALAAIILALGVYLCIALGIIWGALAIFIH